MTCHDLRDALIDHARGVLPGSGSRAAIESHLEHCHACATEHARQRALSQGLRAVARASASEAAPPALEGRLMAAFAMQKAERQPIAPLEAGRSSRWLAVAASIAVVGGLSYAVVNRAVPEQSEIPAKPQATEVRLKPDATTESAGVRLKPDATVESAGVMKLEATNAGRTSRNRGGRRPAGTSTPRPGTRLDEFVALPGAIGLPTFESGRIVRVDLPVSSLPAYGLELVPDAARSEVQADVLVGQDGQARAIRLVTTSSSRSGVRP